MEMHFLTLTYFEPNYSRMRFILTKLFTVEIILDDTCDRYASLREVESLANTLERYTMFDRETVRNERTFGFKGGFKQRRLINGRKSVSSVTREGNA